MATQVFLLDKHQNRPNVAILAELGMKRRTQAAVFAATQRAPGEPR